MLEHAKREINLAIMDTQRKRAFKLTERMTSLVYPSGSFTVSLLNVCEGTVRDFIAVQMLSASGDSLGKPLKFRSYQTIVSERANWERTQTAPDLYVEDPNQPEANSGHANFVRLNSSFDAFVINNHLGLYPKPTADTQLMLFTHVWLPLLVVDADTNFFLDYAYDYILLLALRRMHLFMKVDTRYAVTDTELTKLYQDLTDWDGSIAEQMPFTHA
jgi:hypothetical protein